MAADSPGITTDDHGPGGNGGPSVPATSDDRDGETTAPRPGPASIADDGIPDPPVLTPATGGRRSLRGAGKSARGSIPGAVPAGAGPAPALPRPGDAPVDPAPTVEGTRLGDTAAAPTVPDDSLHHEAETAPAHVRPAGRKTASRRQSRASRRGLRIDQRLWSISPWSVFKVSALFYFCMALIILVAGTLLYNAGRSVGTIDELEGFVTRMGAYGECTPTADVPAGTEFRQDDKCGDEEVLVGGFTLDDGILFRAVVIGGAILVVAGTIGNVLMIVLLNLLNELTGGIRHTVIREPSRRPPADGPPPGSGPPGDGSGGPRPEPRQRLAPPATGSPPAVEQH